MDLLTLLRQGVLFAHTLAFAIALSAVLREDIACFRARCFEAERLDESARTVAYALGVLWATGMALVAFDVGLDGWAHAASPKLVAKLVVVLALTANGLALHRLAFPRLRRQRMTDRSQLFVPVALGAISTASWLYASFIGVSRWVAPLMSFVDFMALYGLVLVVAIAVGLLFIRPRIERLLFAEPFTDGR